MDELKLYVEQEIERLEGLFEKGKGTWPNADYVKDDIWASWGGELDAYRQVNYKLDKTKQG